MKVSSIISKILMVIGLLIILGLTLKSVLITGIVITLVSLNVNFIGDLVEYISIYVKLGLYKIKLLYKS